MTNHRRSIKAERAPQSTSFEVVNEENEENEDGLQGSVVLLSNVSDACLGASAWL
jgi:hypothetical protein